MLHGLCDVRVHHDLSEKYLVYAWSLPFLLFIGLSNLNTVLLTRGLVPRDPERSHAR